MGDNFRTIVEHHVPASEWDAMFASWKTGELKREWYKLHPDLFDQQDFDTNQPSKYFAEWYAAILLKQSQNVLSLVSKFGWHSHRKHPHKQDILRKCLTPQQHQYLLTHPAELFGNNTGWPDLFVYERDFTKPFFCEVKGPNDRLRPIQIPVFKALARETGLDVVMFTFQCG